MDRILENVEVVYVEEDATWFATHPYNGSWNPIKMDTKDDLDYSLWFYDCWYDLVYEQFGENELTDEERKELFKDFVDNLEDWGFKIKKIKN